MRRDFRTPLSGLAFLCALLAPLVPAGSQSPSSGGPGRVKVEATVAPATVPPGGTVEVTLKVTIPPEYHIYALTPGQDITPTEIRLASGQPVVLGAVRGPATKHHRLEIGDYVQEYDYYEVEVEFLAPVTVASAAAPGLLEVRGTLDSMSCTDQTCDPPDSVPWSVKIAVAGEPIAGVVASPSGGTGAPAPPPALPDDAAELQSHGLLLFLLTAVGAGLASLATPCVFPLIPVTLSFFTKQTGSSRARMLLLVSTYCGGIVVSFTGLGLALTFALGQGGVNTFAQNPWVNLGIATLFVVFALSFFGLFDINLPSFVTDRLQVRNRAGFVGALLLGLTFSVVSFTCTAPFVATVLGIATQGGYLWPALGMLAFSIAMALPFFGIGLFPGAAASLAGGNWLHVTKVVMGFIELAASFKFFANVDFAWFGGEYVIRPIVLSVWSVSSLLAALYLFGHLRITEDDEGNGIGVPRMLFGLFFATLGIYFATGLAGGRLGKVEGFLPLFRQGELGYVKEDWIEDFDSARRRSIAEKKPLFVEFTAFT